MHDIIGLYEHNASSYEKIKASFLRDNIVGIVHATGTGKSYNAIKLAYDNKNLKIVYVVPFSGIIEHVKEIISSNPNLNLKRDFPNLEFRAYQSFIPLSKEEIASLDCDLLILDEFHHIGAPVWGTRINTMIETHPNMKVLGMTAYTVRDRGTIYERDMANPETDELFSNKIVSRYDLCDAMIDGVLPKPIYKTAYTNLISLGNKLEKEIKKLEANTKEYKEYMEILSDVKKRIHEAPSIPSLLKKSMKPNGKYIYFCPPNSVEGTNDIETIKKEALKWFKEFVPEEDIVFYQTTSEMGTEGKRNRNAFYNDINLDGSKVDNKLRVMFAINQYNEGVHAPNIDGVIMGRGTSSDIVYFEQLGRALSVRGNTKEKFDELNNFTKEELVNLCNSKDILVKETDTLEDLIEKLVAPVVIDLTNNYDFIKELENNLKDRIKEKEEKGLGIPRDTKLKDASFDIEVENQDLYEMLKYVMDRLIMTWEDKYELASAYYKHYGNLDIKSEFKTIDGINYDENGITLGHWILTQRNMYKINRLSEYRKNKLLEIGMIFESKFNIKPWEERYELAKSYYKHYGNLNIPLSFKTSNGVDYDENGFRLGSWIGTQRRLYKDNKLDASQIKKLEEIKMIFYYQPSSVIGDKMCELASAYYKHYGNLEVVVSFKTKDGITYDENGAKLGEWIQDQREKYKNGRLSKERYNKLIKIGMRFEATYHEDLWNKMYNFAKKYYEHHGNLEIIFHFKTKDGFTYDDDGITLGRWISTQRIYYQKNKLSKDKQEKLEKIGMIFETLLEKKGWYTWYQYACKYYEHHGNSDIIQNFKTKDGINYDENGINLGMWISTQRTSFRNGNLSLDRIEKLEKINIRWFSIISNNKLIREEITESNLLRKKKELQNRLYSLLSNYEGDYLPSKEEINTNFIKRLDFKK